MPRRWRLHLRALGEGARPVTPAQLHGFASAVFEGAGSDHAGQHKPYRVAPLLAAPEPGTALLELAWLDDDRYPDLTALEGHRIRLGSQFFAVEFVSGDAESYAELLRTPPLRRAGMRFVSATYFSRNGRW